MGNLPLKPNSTSNSMDFALLFASFIIGYASSFTGSPTVTFLPLHQHLYILLFLTHGFIRNFRFPKLTSQPIDPIINLLLRFGAIDYKSLKFTFLDRSSFFLFKSPDSLSTSHCLPFVELEHFLIQIQSRYSCFQCFPFLLSDFPCYSLN